MTAHDQAGAAPEKRVLPVDPWLEAAVARQIEAEPDPEEIPTDSEIADWYRHYRPDKVFDKPFTPRQRRDFQRRRRELSKPRAEWKPIDAARYLSTSVTVRLPTPHILLRVKHLASVFKTLHLKFGVSIPEIGRLIDEYLDGVDVSQSLDERYVRRRFMEFARKWMIRNVADFNGDIEGD